MIGLAFALVFVVDHLSCLELNANHLEILQVDTDTTLTFDMDLDPYKLLEYGLGHELSHASFRRPHCPHNPARVELYLVFKRPHFDF